MPSAVVSDPDYQRLKDRLIEFTGLAYYADKDEDLAGRISRRFSELGVRNCASYLHLLQAEGKGESELDVLIAELTIGETYFFRHREQFDALRSMVLPGILDHNHALRRLHIWSAGCATGAEPYSIALLLQQDFAHRIAGWDVSILGTDINRQFLSRAC
jgi:chemotaxis protein methyltransferase CheR